MMPIMKKHLCGAAVSAALGAAILGGCSGASGADEMTMAERKATALDYLTTLSGEGRTLAGTQVNEYEVFIECDSVDRLVEMTGEEPAVLGLELMFAKEYPPFEDYFVSHASEHAARGGLVTIAWHQRNPLRVCPRGEFYTCSQSPMSDEELDRMLTEGTRENDLWKADVAAAAKTLKRLEAEDILVFWRPYHEMNGGWFWWGDTALYPRLWDALYEELEEVHGLTNLIWVWSGDRANPNGQTFWPEQHLPDVTGTDVYEQDNSSAAFTTGAKTNRTLAPDLPFAFTEVGRVPSPSVLAETNPAWVLVWGGEFLNADWKQNQDCNGCNTAEETKAFFAQERIVSLGEMPDRARAVFAGGTPAPASPERPFCPSSLLEN